MGGTELSTSALDGAWESETVWNSGYSPLDDSYLASGGGISPTNSLPSWQQDLDMTANQGSRTQRNVPDVAIVAGNIWVRHNHGDSTLAVGTSASAPLWAGIVALANELAQSNGQPPVGFLNPAIYLLGKGSSYTSLFHDITQGNNTNPSRPTNYFAVSGYDLCTGWGTPSGRSLLSVLGLPDHLQITPGTNVTALGSVGGPFNPISQTFSLLNAGSTALDWALGYDALG